MSGQTGEGRPTSNLTKIMKLLKSINMLFVEEMSEVIRTMVMMTVPKFSKCGKNLPTFRRNKLSPCPGYKTRHTPYYGILRSFSLTLILLT
jgi:hypothetical protein